MHDALQSPSAHIAPTFVGFLRGMNMEMTNTKLIPVNEWVKHHPWPPIGGLRHLIFNEETNGFNKVVRRIGSRVLIDEAAFFEWVNEVTKPRTNKRRRASSYQSVSS
jgi:hypothetical protein